MIRFRPLWHTMETKSATTYTLRVLHGMSHSTVQRLQADMPVSTYTIDNLIINFSKNNQNKKYIKVTCSNIFISCAS